MSTEAIPSFRTEINNADSPVSSVVLSPAVEGH